jgi:LCP family protein required for cell wall assembly
VVEEQSIVSAYGMRMRAEAHKNGRKRRWGVRATTAFSVVVLATSGVGHVMVHGINSKVHRIDPFHDLADRPKDTGGVNFLIVGTDRRDNISAEQRQKYKLGGSACDCTDTLMLVHLSAQHDRASVVSLPRDSYTKLPAYTDHATGARHPSEPAKLNSAYARGGASLAVSTVEGMTHVHIDHYLEIDFSSFMRTVDVLGGVPVCTTEPLHDSYSGLDLPAGTTKLDGGRALQYVRARHLGDGSDLARMKRQQRFLASVIDKATANGVLMNPVKLDKVASTALKSVRADNSLSSSQMLELARAMRGFTAASSEFASVPISDPDHRVPELGSTVKWDEEKARRIFEALREDKPLAPGKKPGKHARGAVTDGLGGRAGSRHAAVPIAIPPGSVQVQVENGTDEAGLGRNVDDALRGTGFATTGTPHDAAHLHASRTTIAYDPRWDRSASSLAKALPGARLVREKGRGPVMRVTVGSHHREIRRVRVASPAEGGERIPGATLAQANGAVTGDKVSCA